MLGPVDPCELVVDQRVGGLGVGHAQKRFGEAHQRNALLGAEPVSREKRIEPTRLAGAGTFDQTARKGCGFGVMRRDRRRLA